METTKGIFIYEVAPFMIFCAAVASRGFLAPGVIDLFGVPSFPPFPFHRLPSLTLEEEALKVTP